jgi:hypothetical protein
MNKVLLGFLLTTVSSVAFAQNAITTRAFDNNRTGTNYNETVLSPASIQAKGLRVLMTIPIPDDARGTENQPLIVPNVLMDDDFTHNVLYIGSMGDNVYAYDADYGTMLWERHIGNAIPDTKAIDYWQIQDHWGVLSTGVIDQSTNTYYVVDIASPDGQDIDSSFYLHGLSLSDGHDMFPPVDLNLATYTSPTHITSLLNAVPRKQRPALLLTKVNGKTTVFIASGSFNEDANTNRGWIVAVDATNPIAPAISAVFATTSKYSGAGIWMSGGGLNADSNGDIYCITGNGAFDGNTEFGNSFLRLHYTPPTADSLGTLTPVQWFAPFNDVGRVGYSDQTLADTSLIPNGGYSDMPGGSTSMDSPKDEDLGCG